MVRITSFNDGKIHSRSFNFTAKCCSLLYTRVSNPAAHVLSLSADKAHLAHPVRELLLRVQRWNGGYLSLRSLRCVVKPYFSLTFSLRDKMVENSCYNDVDFFCCSGTDGLQCLTVARERKRYFAVFSDLSHEWFHTWNLSKHHFMRGMHPPLSVQMFFSFLWIFWQKNITNNRRPLREILGLLLPPPPNNFMILQNILLRITMKHLFTYYPLLWTTWCFNKTPQFDTRFFISPPNIMLSFTKLFLAKDQPRSLNCMVSFALTHYWTNERCAHRRFTTAVTETHS